MILLIRPRWVEGESWGGYLLRLSEINGLDGVKSLSKRLNLSVVELMTSSPHEVLLRLGIHQRAPGLTTRLHNARRSLYSRVCPLCLSQHQHPHIPSIWDLGLNLVCKIHELCLLDTCPSCSKPIDFFRSSIFRCTCGQDFRLIDMPTAPDHLQMVERAFGVEQMRADASRTFAPKGNLEGFGVLALRRLISLSDPDNMFINRRSQRYAYYQSIRLNDLERVSKWFEDWPHGFVNGIRTARTSFQSAKRSFVPKSIFTANRFPLIMKVLELEEKEAKWWSDENSRSAIQVDPNQVQPRGVVNVQTISKMTGVSFNVVVEWIKRGFLGDVLVSVSKTGRARYEIDAQRARDAGQFFARTSTLSQLAELVGTESDVLRLLALAEVFPIHMVSRGIRLARVRPEHVFDIARRLIGKASYSATIPYPTYSFTQAVLRLKPLTPPQIRRFMDDLGTGALPLQCRQANTIRLDDLLVSWKDLNSWRSLQLERLKK